MKHLLSVLSLFLFFSCSNNDKTTVDTTAPLITLLGDATITITLGTPYVDAGATASDNVDGDLSTSISVSNPIDINILGNYTITYDVSDSSGNSTMATRTVNVVPAAFSTAIVEFETYFDIETETICPDFDCDIIIDPNYDLTFAYGGGTVHARMWWNEQYTDMALVYDKSFDELSFFYVSNYYFCEHINDPNAACANTDTEPTDFVGLYKTNEGNYFAVEFISEGTFDEGVTFRYKLLE